MTIDQEIRAAALAAAVKATGPTELVWDFVDGKSVPFASAELVVMTGLFDTYIRYGWTGKSE